MLPYAQDKKVTRWCTDDDHDPIITAEVVNWADQAYFQNVLHDCTSGRRQPAFQLGFEEAIGVVQATRALPPPPGPGDVLQNPLPGVTARPRCRDMTGDGAGASAGHTCSSAVCARSSEGHEGDGSAVEADREEVPNRDSAAATVAQGRQGVRSWQGELGPSVAEFVEQRVEEWTPCLSEMLKKLLGQCMADLQREKALQHSQPRNHRQAERSVAHGLCAARVRSSPQPAAFIGLCWRVSGARGGSKAERAVVVGRGHAYRRVLRKLSGFHCRLA
jgi:hypothetical protein